MNPEEVLNFIQAWSPTIVAAAGVIAAAVKIIRSNRSDTRKLENRLDANTTTNKELIVKLMAENNELKKANQAIIQQNDEICKRMKTLTEEISKKKQL